MAKCKKIVSWIGGIVQRVVKWFDNAIKAMVNGIVVDFLKTKKREIQKAENPDKVAKVVAQKKYLQELQKIVEEGEKELSENDLNAVNSMFNEEDFDI